MDNLRDNPHGLQPLKSSVMKNAENYLTGANGFQARGVCVKQYGFSLFVCLYLVCMCVCWYVMVVAVCVYTHKKIKFNINMTNLC